ncbi:competence protein ComEA [Microlunatus flavus]|uniref:Competence protein ComEA n=2 Tax=Microlunatus flavus TaxID=1036181 RepID=A0A1H9DC62_9ACTN|nr:competence protein ComEA [Microlunatus flavus]
MGGGDVAAGPRRAAGARRSGEREEQEDAAGLLDPGPTGPGRPLGPDDLEPPRRFTRWHLGVVAAVLLVGVVWGGWSWLQARPEAVAAPTVAPAPAQSADATGSSGSSSSPSSASASATAAPADPGASGGAGQQAAGPVVHVLGAVRHPGLVHLKSGARVEDALEAAGGLRRDADPGELNLAQPLEDGVQVVVGTRQHPAGEVRAGPGGTAGGTSGTAAGTARTSGGTSGGAAGSVVDLNRATVDQLDTLPGVGPVTAQKILDWREQHGRFSRAEELQEVDGIGPKTYARIAPHVRV